MSITSQLGYFIDYGLWKEALRLLNYQIEQKKKNRHYSTLSMFYYERLGSKVALLEDRAYFEKRVASNLFYGLSEEFAVYSYFMPKARVGLRNYKFLAYPMRVLYYSIGLYLLKVSQEFVVEYVGKQQNIASYYGAKLQFEPTGLIISPYTTYYRNHYKAFRKRARQEIEGDIANKLILRLDITDYFDRISMPILLQLLNEKVKPSIRKELKFDAATIEQINTFFQYLSSGKSGIPQADNDIVSGYISYLYLVFGDLLINDEIFKDKDVLECHSIIRYVDDIFISITFRDDVPQDIREQYAESLTARVADVLYHKLGLNLNPKTRLFWLNDEDHKKELLKTLKKISPQYPINNEDDDASPENKIANIFDELKKLKRLPVDPLLQYDKTLEEEILSEVFDKRVEQMLAIPQYRTRIQEIFEDFNFDLVKASPLEILIVILKDVSATERFRDFLLNKKYLTTKDIDLILKFLGQTHFKDTELLQKLQQNLHMTKIVETFLGATLSTDHPGYYSLSETKTLKLVDMPQVIDQIRLRVVNEQIGAYSVSLNHLLNEIHAICWTCDLPANKDYTATNVIEFLGAKTVPHDVCIGIRNLFDRRNTNQISHPGSDANISWGVTVEEYHIYRTQVGECLSFIL